MRVHESRVVHNGGSENFSVCMHMPHAVGEPHCIVLLLLLTLATLLSFKPPHRLSSPQHPGIEQHIYRVAVETAVWSPVSAGDCGSRDGDPLRRRGQWEKGWVRSCGAVAEICPPSYIHTHEEHLLKRVTCSTSSYHSLAPSRRYEPARRARQLAELVLDGRNLERDRVGLSAFDGA